MGILENKILWIIVLNKVPPIKANPYLGGTLKNRISLNSISDNKRLCQNAKPEDLKILTNYKWILT